MKLRRFFFLVNICGGLKANVLVRCVGTQMLIFSGYDFLFEQSWTQYLHNLINFRTEKENCLENTLERDPTVFQDDVQNQI